MDFGRIDWFLSHRIQDPRRSLFTCKPIVIFHCALPAWKEKCSPSGFMNRTFNVKSLYSVLFNTVVEILVWWITSTCCSKELFDFTRPRQEEHMVYSYIFQDICDTHKWYFEPNRAYWIQIRFISWNNFRSLLFFLLDFCGSWFLFRAQVWNKKSW